MLAAQRRLLAELRADPEVQPVSIQAPVLGAQGADPRTRPPLRGSSGPA